MRKFRDGVKNTMLTQCQIATSCKHTDKTFVKAFHKETEEQLFKSMDTQKLQDNEKVLTIWVKNLKI